MKHIIFTLLLLIGATCAAAASEFEQTLMNKFNQQPAMACTPYTITIILADVPVNGSAMKLSDDYYLVNQWHRFWGFNTAENNEITDDNTYAHEFNTPHHTYTAQPGKLPVFWMQNDSGTQSGVRNAGNHIYISISSDGADTTITLDYDLCSVTDTLILKNTVLNPGLLQINEKATIVRHTIEIEEPRFSIATIIGLLLGVLSICGLMFIGQRSLQKKMQ